MLTDLFRIFSSAARSGMRFLPDLPSLSEMVDRVVIAYLPYELSPGRQMLPSNTILLQQTTESRMANWIVFRWVDLQNIITKR